MQHKIGLYVCVFPEYNDTNKIPLPHSKHGIWVNFQTQKQTKLHFKQLIYQTITQLVGINLFQDDNIFQKVFKLNQS